MCLAQTSCQLDGCVFQSVILKVFGYVNQQRRHLSETTCGSEDAVHRYAVDHTSVQIIQWLL